jgi:hydrogenase maturation protease
VSGEYSVLVAGIGNIFLSDDGFGVEVANRLAGTVMPAEVRVAEFGIRGVHLAYELLEGYDSLVLIDAVDVGQAPGTVVVLQPDLGASGGSVEETPVVDAHTMSPDVVLGTLAHLGGTLKSVFVVGCQPACLDEGIGLSPTVQAALEGAAQLCNELVVDLVRPVRKEART